MSGYGLTNAAEPFSPIQTISYFYLSLFTISLISLIVAEFIPPHNPLSVVIGIISILFGSFNSYFEFDQVSFSNTLGIISTPKFFPLSSLNKSYLLFEEATIFIAFVIFPIFDTTFILVLIYFSAPEKQNILLFNVDASIVCFIYKLNL